MKNITLEQFKATLRSISRMIFKAQNAADAAQEAANIKMNAENPIGTGYIAMNALNIDIPGKCSSVLGQNCAATGSFAHAEGQLTRAEGMNAHAEGHSSCAVGVSSHAEGNNTKAIGPASHSEGSNTEAHGNSSHAEGTRTIARYEDQHVQGRYNLPGTYAHIVGNGTGEEINGEPHRSNAHTLDWDGNAWYAGTVEGTALILKSSDGKRFKITVSDSGALTATVIT